MLLESAMSRDLVEAYAWILLANQDQELDYSEQLQQLEGALNESELSRAQSRAIEIQARIVSGVGMNLIDKQQKEMIRYSDGSIYVGTATDGKPDGQGTYMFPDDRFIFGDFVDGDPQFAVEFDGNSDVIATFLDGVRTEGGVDEQIATGNWTAEGFANALLADESLIDIDLSGENLSGRSFSWRNLTRANLSGAVLSNANLSRANLTGADLSGADLRRANLTAIQAAAANLSGADLSNADLRDAFLGSANLAGANLSGADLSGADLNDANLLDANLTETVLENAVFSNTTMPDGSIKN